MKCNILFKLFTLFFTIFMFIGQVCAQTIEANILSKIMIEQAADNSYKINLFFDKKFTGNAFIQKGKEGSYYIYIPETVIKSDKIKIAYKNRQDKKNIKISIEEKPFIKENSESNYVRLSVGLNKAYSLRLLAQTIENENNVFPLKTFNYNYLMLIVLFSFIIFFIQKMVKITKTNVSRSYTSFPKSYLLNKDEFRTDSDLNEPVRQNILPKVNIKKTLRSMDSNSFSCFDVPLVEENRQSSYEFNSMLKQTSNLLKEKATKSKQTNPIAKNYLDDSLQLDLPVVEDIKKKDEPETKNLTPELLSELHITPTKGFYLTTIDDAFALFGYVGEKVFLLQKFNDLTQINLQARFYDRKANSDMYIVRLDSYKAMVEISDEGMKELAVL